MSPTQLEGQLYKKSHDSEKWLHTDVLHSCFPFNKSKLTAEPWDNFLVFTPYKNFIDPSHILWGPEKAIYV